MQVKKTKKSEKNGKGKKVKIVGKKCNIKFAKVIKWLYIVVSWLVVIAAGWQTGANCNRIEMIS